MSRTLEKQQARRCPHIVAWVVWSVIGVGLVVVFWVTLSMLANLLISKESKSAWNERQARSVELMLSAINENDYERLRFEWRMLKCRAEYGGIRRRAYLKAIEPVKQYVRELPSSEVVPHDLLTDDEGSIIFGVCSGQNDLLPDSLRKIELERFADEIRMAKRMGRKSILADYRYALDRLVRGGYIRDTEYGFLNGLADVEGE